MLRERGDTVAVETRAERALDAGVGGRAGHEPQRRCHAVAATERGHLRQAKLEEGAPRQGLHERFHDAAHARRHAARQHDQCDVSGPKRLGASLLELPRCRRPGRGQLEDVTRRGRLDAARHEAAIDLAAGERRTEPE